MTGATCQSGKARTGGTDRRIIILTEPSGGGSEGSVGFSEDGEEEVEDGR